MNGIDLNALGETVWEQAILGAITGAAIGAYVGSGLGAAGGAAASAPTVGVIAPVTIPAGTVVGSFWGAVVLGTEGFLIGTTTGLLSGVIEQTITQ